MWFLLRDVGTCALFLLICWSDAKQCADVDVYNTEHPLLSTEVDLLQTTVSVMQSSSKIKCVVFCLNSPACQTAVYYRPLQKCYFTTIMPNIRSSPPYVINPSVSANLKNSYTYFAKIGENISYFNVYLNQTKQHCLYYVMISTSYMTDKNMLIRTFRFTLKLYY